MSTIDSVIVLAYLDPGTGSMLLQAVVGGAAGIIVFGRYLLNRYLPSLTRRRS